MSYTPTSSKAGWKDTGKLEDMLEANRIILDTLTPRTDGAVEDSDISGKVVIEPARGWSRARCGGPPSSARAR